jgi:hypothetical protein
MIEASIPSEDWHVSAKMEFFDETRRSRCPGCDGER